MSGMRLPIVVVLMRGPLLRRETRYARVRGPAGSGNRALRIPCRESPGKESLKPLQALLPLGRGAWPVRPGAPQVGEREVGRLAAPGGPLEEPLLDQVGLIDVLHGVGLFS